MIAVLLAVIAGGVLFLLTQDGEEAPAAGQEPTTQTETPEDEATPSIAPSTLSPTPTESQSVSYGPVRTDDPAFALSIESVSAGENSVIVGFALTHEGEGCHSFEYTSRQFARAYIVDDATNQKFEVVVDANGNALVSETLGAIPCEVGDTFGFTIQFTAPPSGSSVTVVVPFAQPLPGVQL